MRSQAMKLNERNGLTTPYFYDFRARKIKLSSTDQPNNQPANEIMRGPTNQIDHPRVLIFYDFHFFGSLGVLTPALVFVGKADDSSPTNPRELVGLRY